MASSNNESLDPRDIVRKLTSLPHRGVGTQSVDNAATFMKEALENAGAAVASHLFLCPRTYLPMVWWLVGGIVFGLVCVDFWPWPSFGVAAIFALMGVAHFDWRFTPLAFLVPRVRAENIIARHGSGPGEDAAGAKKIILMAHYDSAPISFLYRPSMLKGFRRSLLICVALMMVSPMVIFLEAIGLSWALVAWLRYGLVGYFLVQAVLSSVDYFRFGFTNGAADNATGVAAAMATAYRLWQNNKDGWEVELVLTSGEEVAMVGARAYFIKNKHDWDKEKTYVLNFDNIGSGKLKIITETGSLTPVRYNNPLVQAAEQVARDDSRFTDIGTASWHTGDFDSIWFARAGIASLTLSAQDKNGLIPHLHRPGDTFQNVDLALLPQAVDFAVTTLARITSR